MSRREFQLIDGTSNKFWAIQLDGNLFTVQYGRIGTSGQTQEKSFKDEDAAKREYDKLILEKTKKGYLEVGAESSVASATVPVSRASSKVKRAKSVEETFESIAVAHEGPAAASASVGNVSSVASNSAPTVPTAFTRSLNLDAQDRLVVTWIEHQQLEKPACPPFDLQDCLQRLRSVGETVEFWHQDWRKARIPQFPSPAEARFWLLAFHECRTGKTTPSAVADRMAKAPPNSNLAVSEIVEIYRETWRAPNNIFACIAALVSPEDFLVANWKGQHTAGCQLAEAFRAFVLPYLTTEDCCRLKKTLTGRITPTIPATYYDSWPSHYYLGALLGCHDELLAVVRGLSDDFYRTDTAGFRHDYYHSPQWVVFGLADSQTVQTEFRRLGIKLRTREEARAWLALTEFSGLDVIASSTCAATSKDEAAKPASALLLVEAPEAAVAALQISIASKAPQIGQEWLNRHSCHAAIGLVPTAMGQGKLAEAAREHLRTMRRGNLGAVLIAAIPHLTVEQAAWLQREILDSSEETLPEVSRDDLPEPLRAAFHEVKSSKGAGWLTVAALPVIKIQGRKLATAEIGAILAELKATPVGTHSPLLSALKDHVDGNTRDAFAWKVFDLWHSMGAPAKDKWAMGAIGHLGGDACVLKLTPLVREWPGESQHQRAVFGLECLRAVGSDTALMALNGIAQKLKFKGLKEKAQAMMEGIAEARGFTREQLADRIVPDCGLDERGSRVFDFGPRQFRFVLGAEMKPLVRDVTGKVRPDLPAPNSSDDREKAEAAVADWKLLKKTLREVLKIQADRLEDAMITGRRWTPEEFQTLLVKQPLMLNLVRQLVFAVYDDVGKAAQSFRVTEDQTLADQNDDAMELPATGWIGVVHPAHFDEGVRGAWGQVFSDYEIIPPFQQLGRAICRPEAEDLEKTEITRYRGPKVPGIVMYGMLERSHWLRDSPADGGGFMQHSKYFAAANLTAFIQYSGMSIGYYEEPQELASVYFVPGHVKPDWWGEHKNRLKIKEVDAVVLSEVLRLANAIITKAV